MSYSNDEFKKIENMKSQLDSVSDSFCLVRWKHATLNLATGASKSCCHHDFKSIDTNNSFEQLHDNSEEQQNRQKMLRGEKTKDCSYCWWVEDNGHGSDRQNWSAKSWMSPFFREVTKTLSPQASAPSWVELNFSSLCNLKCVYCSPIFSTQWYKEIKTHGTLPTRIPHNSISELNHVEFEDNYENTDLLKKFWPWFHNSLPSIRLLKITGGEPLLSPQTFRLLEMIQKMHLPELSLGINSNLSIQPKLWSQFLESIKKIEANQSLSRIYLHPSLDTFGGRAEYIRTGLDLSLLKNNVESFLSETNSSVHFICTLNNLALGGLLDFWKYLLDLKRNFYVPGREIAMGTEVLQHPSWLNINILPAELGSLLEEVIDFVESNIDDSGRGFNYVELEGLKKAKSSYNSKAEDKVGSMKDLHLFLTEIDRRRNLNSRSVFPELNSFFDECHLLVQSEGGVSQ